MVELMYTKVGDCYIPNLVLDEPEPVKTVGKYGSLRCIYLKQHKHKLWRDLAGSGTLKAHLLDIDETANKWIDKMLPEMMAAVGATVELKAHDQMAWVGLVNNCKAKINEIIYADLIYP